MGAINLQIDTKAVNAEIDRLIKEDDARSERIANRLLMEGKNWAHQLVKKDTGALDTSIDTASYVTKIEPCIYGLTIGASMEYASNQEFDPKRGRPYIRPAVRVMQLRARGICQEEYER